MNAQSLSATHHQPVLLTQVLQQLKIYPQGRYVDCTFGRGGHSRALLAQLGPKGQLLALDQDPEAVRVAQTLSEHDQRFEIVHSAFSQLKQIITERNWLGQVNGIIFDLGVSLPQLNTPERGVSFQHSGPLDMRMNPTQGEPLSRWLAQASMEQLAWVFKQYGEERYARRIARALVAHRQHTPLTTTYQLAEVIKQAHPAWEMGKHPATRCFQALRIFVNQELEQLQQALTQTLEVLAPQGRLVVISFHSLEDRIVKRFIRTCARGDPLPAHIPLPHTALKPKLRIIGKPMFPDADEIAHNPQARSAVLRTAERCVDL